MNNISKSHKRFSDRLRNPRVLECPEEFLGENYEAVLNFWLILDDLSEEQLRVVEERYLGFREKNFSDWKKAADLALAAAKELVGWNYQYAGWATQEDTICRSACFTTTFAIFLSIELIGMHLILEQQKPLTFLPMFLNL